MKMKQSSQEFFVFEWMDGWSWKKYIRFPFLSGVVGWLVGWSGGRGRGTHICYLLYCSFYGSLNVTVLAF
jgi:hypothetical protein